MSPPARPAPGAFLRPKPVEVDIGDLYTAVIPALPADRWIVALTVGGLLGVVPGLVTDTDRVIDDALAIGGVTVAELTAAAKTAVEAACGMRWWAAWRLVVVSETRLVAGRIALAGVDPGAVSIGRWCAAVFAVLADGQDEKGLRKMERAVDSAPPGTSAAERYDPELAAAAFDRVH